MARTCDARANLVPLFAGWLCAGVAAAVTGSHAMAESEQAALKPEQAVAAVAAFFAREGLHATPEQVASRIGAPALMSNQELGPLVSFRGGLGQIWVSPRGNVVFYSGSVLGAPDPAPAPGEFIEVARRFAARHVADFAKRNYALEPPKIDQKSATVRWTEKPRVPNETAIFPNWVEVQVQLPSGRVARFSASDLRLVRRTPPRLSEAQARAAIRSRFTKSAIEEIELMELPRPGGQSMTVWTALVMTLADESPITRRVTIDADTGALIPE